MRLDGTPVTRINADLTGARIDFTMARPLRENRGVAFMGDTKGGAFDIPGDLAREWLQLPLNPNGRPNSDVLRPWMNGMDLTRQPSGRWIIDFGWEMSEQGAALYEAPYAYIFEHVRPVRLLNRRDGYQLSGGATLNRGPACGEPSKVAADISQPRPSQNTGRSAG